ncbi:MAG TPA: metallophosphoesterase family protein [Gemmatimonadales bacterium]|jgi:putative phosphoesterase|nr:metallophosphoesterase family protein [Gemmatimonadales bacterium]
MIMGLLSDAHGNAEALEGCLDAIERQGAERIYFLGDAVGYFPEENAVLELLRSREAICIRGNHEAMLLGKLTIPEPRDTVYRLADASTRLHDRHRAWMQDWPDRLELSLDGCRVLLVHGSPADPIQGYLYPDSDLTPLRELPFDLVAMGHTHRPFLTSAGPVTVMNVGSSGMPRDVGNLASCARYDTKTGAAEILRVPFDASGLARRWGDRIDPSAAACLRRVADGPVIGRTVPA